MTFELTEKQIRAMQQACMHYVERIYEKPYRYRCTKCGQKQKILSGVLKKETK